MTGTMDAAPKVVVKGGVVPYLLVGGAMQAVELYRNAFDAELAFAYPPDEQGRTMHAHIYINGSSVMLGDAFPEHGHPLEKPAGFSMTIAVEDVDFWFERAAAAGLDVVMPVQDMFWGDRYGQLRDRFGVSWSFNGPQRRP